MPRALLALLAIVVPISAEDKADQQAKEIANQVMNALKDGDLDSFMKLIDTPFLTGKGDVIEDRDRFKRDLKQAFEKKPYAKLAFEIKFVKTFREVRDGKVENVGEGTKEQRQFMDKHLGKEDRVVFLELSFEGNLKEIDDRWMVLVRFKEGVVKVVGITG